MSALDKGFKKHSAANDEDDTVGATAEDIIESTKDFLSDPSIYIDNAYEKSENDAAGYKLVKSR